jgi:hypothetical protein
VTLGADGKPTKDHLKRCQLAARPARFGFQMAHVAYSLAHRTNSKTRDSSRNTQDARRFDTPAYGSSLPHTLNQ